MMATPMLVAAVMPIVQEMVPVPRAVTVKRVQNSKLVTMVLQMPAAVVTLIVRPQVRVLLAATETTAPS